MTSLCPHGDKDWRCPVCCILSLRRDLRRLERAVRANEKSTGGGASSFGSRVPTGFGVAALALLQDINTAGGLDYIERQLNTLTDPEALADMRKKVRQYRSRCALILHDALAPYPLTWDTPGTTQTGEEIVETKPVPCPVVHELGQCGADLMVHRDNDPKSEDYGKAAIIRCRHNDDHEWTLRNAGWLRLGVLLGGVA